MTNMIMIRHSRFLAGLVILALVLAACGGGGDQNVQATPPPSSAAVVKVAYASSAQNWMDQAIAAFNRSAVRTADGKQIVVQGKPLASGAMVEEMVTGAPAYQMIIPADKLWVDLLAARRKERSETPLNIGACTPVARSPIVAITWKSMADVLGWPEREFNWTAISELALSPSAWQGYDHPEWGTLTFGHAHPVLSHAGLAAILGEAYAVAPLTQSDAQSEQVKSYVRVVERSVARYGSDSRSLVKSMAEKGQRFLHIAIGYESDVIANSKGGDDDLVAIYPTETFVATYSTCVLDGNTAAGQFADYLLSDAAQRAALATGFRPVAAGVALGAPIDAAHGANATAQFKILPLPPVDVVRTLQNTWGELKRPLNVTLVIDVSGSMGEGGKIDAARTGAAAFVNRLGDDDVLTLYTFSTGINPRIVGAKVGEKRNDILNIIKDLSASGSTALYDVALETRRNIKIDPTRINAIVLLTDGRDTASSNKNVPSVVKTLTEAKGNVTIYTIGYGGDVDANILAQIASAGNGNYFSGDPATINQVYLEIASQFGGSRGLGR